MQVLIPETLPDITLAPFLDKLRNRHMLHVKRTTALLLVVFRPDISWNVFKFLHGFPIVKVTTVEVLTETFSFF